MESWYLFAVASLILLGSQRFLYKVAAEKHCNSGLVTAVFMATVTLLSGCLFFISGGVVGEFLPLLTLALVNSATFASATIAHIEALRRLPAGVTYPLTRLSLVLVILVSVVWFGERLAPLQWLGILFGLLVVFVLARDVKGEGPTEDGNRSGGLLIGVCVICGAIASISSKLAAVSTSKEGFMALSYLFGTGFSLLIATRWGQGVKVANLKPVLLIGSLMGILNFFGFYAFLSALQTGPLSVIALMTGMHFVIAILLSFLLYRERQSPARLLAIGLTVLAVVLMKQ